MKTPIEANLTKAETLSDNSAKITFVTAREVTADTLADLFASKGEGWLWFDQSEQKPSVGATAPAQAPRGKITPSQQMRLVLMKLWEKEGAKGDFDTEYYPKSMATIIAKLEDQL